MEEKKIEKKKYVDLTGQKFGRLTVIERAERRTGHGEHAHWVCMCDCGKVTVVKSSDLTCGKTKSCGCFREEMKLLAHTTHGDGKHGDNRNRLYHIWADMKNRCNSPSNHAYQHYGARGISVCEEWNAYENFKVWALSNGYEEDLTIDRIDVNGNYEPRNCRWITKQEQCYNKTNSRTITYQGETKTVSQWAFELGLPRTTLAHRLDDGWSIEAALTVPPQKKGVHAC